jgi:hypothetical protein
VTQHQFTAERPLRHEGEGLFLVQGTLSELHVARTSVNLLEQIDANVRSKSTATGVAGALGGMHGVVANSAALALYAGEDSYNFAALLGEQVICGSFPHADQFKNGEKVKAVVSRRGEVLYVHAIMNAATQRFYMPMNVFSGTGGFFRNCMRIAWRFTIVGWAFFGLLAIFTGLFSDSQIGYHGKVFAAVFFALFPPLVMFPFEYWTYRSFRGGGTYGEAIFRVFGFRDVMDIDLTRDADMRIDDKGWYGAWDATRLLQASQPEAA